MWTIYLWLELSCIRITAAVTFEFLDFTFLYKSSVLSSIMNLCRGCFLQQPKVLQIFFSETRYSLSSEIINMINLRITDLIRFLSMVNCFR